MVYRIASIGEKIIEIRSTLQLQELCVNGKKIAVLVESDPNHNSTTMIVVCKCTFESIAF